MKIAAFAALLLITSAPAQAAQWAVDPLNSIIAFNGKQGGAPFQGGFSRWTASIDFDPAKPEAGKASVEIDMASAFTNSREKDQALPEADWFHAKLFPKARFEATAFRAKGGNAYEAIGTLAIRDIKKDVVLPFTLDIKGDTAKAKGGLKIVRTEYGVGQGTWKTGDTVALDVGIEIEITATVKP